MITITVPKIQSTDRVVNQLQTNISNAVQTLGNDLNLLTIIGEVKLSPLNETQFQSQASDAWLLCDGRSCMNTEYFKITGRTTIPNLTPVNGNNFFIRVV